MNWLAKAEEDISAAESLASHGDTFLATVCFHAQQAAEKYLKAFLTQHQIEFPKTHDIAQILDIVADVDARLSATLQDAIVLTSYGVDVRYPSDYPSVNRRDTEEALQVAQRVRQGVLAKL